MWQIPGIVALMWMLWKVAVGWPSGRRLDAHRPGTLTADAAASAGIAVGLVVPAAGHAVFLLRHGYWKPRILRRLNDTSGIDAQMALSDPGPPQEIRLRTR